MRRKLIFESDKLEIEKYREQQVLANQTTEASVLYDDLKDAQEVKEEEGEVSDPTAGALDSPNPEGDVVPAQESIRLFFTTESQQVNVSQESLSSLVGSAVHVASTVAGFTADNIRAALVLIGTLGITYGPSIIKNVFKGVIYAFGKLVKLLYVGSKSIAEFIDRRINSLENIKKSIGEYRKSLDLISQKQDETSETQADSSEVSYGNVKVINSLKIGSSTDFSKNVLVLNQFLDVTVKGIFDSIHDDIGLMKYTMDMYDSGRKGYIRSNVLLNKKRIPGLEQGQVEGYNHDTTYTVTYRSAATLPSDVVLMCNFPRSEIEGYENIVHAFNASSITLGVDPLSFKTIDRVPYLDIVQTRKLLDDLEKLVDTCIAQQAFFEKLKVERAKLNRGIRNYFARIANSSHKVTLSDSYFEDVYLKATFIDKVYLVAAMDIHDYATKVLTNGLTFAKENIRQLS